jgi:aromatic-L-amino-acid decarboxylase
MSHRHALDLAHNLTLELTAEQILEADRAVSERLAHYMSQYSRLSPMGMAHDPWKNGLRSDYKVPYASSLVAPEEPCSLDSSLDLIFNELSPHSQAPGHPGYMAYVAGSGNHISSLAQMISMDINAFTSHRMMAPGLVALEEEALDWFKTIFDYPKSAAGFFTTGSSLASLSALVTARFKKLNDDWSDAVIYVSDQSHHCLRKAARLAGFRESSIRVIPTSAVTFQISISELKKAIQTDRASGLKPFFVVGTAGTTNTGAIDDLGQIAEIAQQENLWFHADGAYGALFCLTTNLTSDSRKHLNELHKADSLCFDLHKSFGLSYGTGALLVKDEVSLKRAHSGETASPHAHASYMPPSPEAIDGGDHADFADLTPELSRDWRGLRVWLPIKTFGIKPFRENLEEKLKLARLMAKEVGLMPELEVLAQPQLSIFAFAVKGFSLEENNRRTFELMARVNSQNRIFLSGCVLNGRRAIRVCLLSFRAHESEMRLALAEIRRELCHE